MHATIGGAVGVALVLILEIGDKNLAYIVAAKMLIMTVIDLLSNGAEKAIEIKRFQCAAYQRRISEAA